MSIKILSERTINRIAAGEVIERPVSAVKELVENAIDANSTSITVSLIDGGFTKITVSDTGKGMGREDLVLAVERHATSKLDEEDIYNITHMGFRGEALPSIGAVSLLTIISRTSSDSNAWSVSVKDSVKEEVRPAAHSIGTTVEVQNLFSNMPVKLKFSKSARSEEIACTDLMDRLALAHPEIAFELRNATKSLLSYPTISSSNPLDARIAQVLGADFYKNSNEFHVKLHDITVYGRAGLPTYTASNSTQQYIYVNQRITKDKFLIQCVRNAYRGLIADGKFPAIVLFIEIGTREVDVNVHPTKAEVRFCNEEVIRNVINKAIKEAVRYIKAPDQPSLTYGANPREQAPAFIPITPAPRSYNTFSPYPLPSTNAPLSNELAENTMTAPTTSTEFPASTYSSISTSSFSHNLDVQSELLESDNVLGQAIGQIDNTYIVAQTKDGIVIVDQHAAHERITLERIKAANSNASSQPLLIPLVVELGNTLTESLLLHKTQLAQLGLTIERNGPTQVVVRSAPSLVHPDQLKDLVRNIAEAMQDGDLGLLSHKVEEILGNVACHNSIRAGQRLNIPQMNHLLREMEQTTFAGQCNHGRPTYIRLSIKELAKLFERT